MVHLPYYKLVNPVLINECHENNVKIISRTVDDSGGMQTLISMGVDGIITDYPDRLAGLKK